MKKGILIFGMSLYGFLCTAQFAGESAEVPPVVITASDTATLITDLISAVNEKTRVILSWKRNKAARLDFIAVERSNGGNDFEVVAVLKQSDSSTQNEWMDEAPARGRNLYRVRYAGKDGQVVYSNIVSALINGDTTCRFYPNPVDNILIIRSDSDVDIQIVDGMGKVRISQNGLQGLKTINVTSLEKGFYLLRINSRSTGIITQEKLLKN